MNVCRGIGEYEALADRDARFTPYRNDRDDRVAVFMDVRNVYAVLSNKGIEADFDFRKLLVDVLNGRRCVAAVAVDSNFHDDDERATRFQCHLKDCGFRLNLVSATNSLGKQEGTDVELALSAYKYAIKDACDTVAIVSGDGDFSVLVRRLQEEAKVVEVFSFDETLSRSLSRKADRVQSIDTMPLIRMRQAGEDMEVLG
jgi:uncharacterized LabA/DUF88 family protein